GSPGAYDSRSLPLPRLPRGRRRVAEDRLRQHGEGRPDGGSWAAHDCRRPRATLEPRQPEGGALSDQGSALTMRLARDLLLFLIAATAAYGAEPARAPLNLKGHGGSVMAVAFSPDSKLLASSSRDGSIRLWDARTGQSRQTLLGHTMDVYSVVFSPDGSLIASGSGDKTIRLWDARTNKALRTLEGHTDIVRS